ncbi:MAG: AIM24 family protein [Erysipelotrichia bacterium]|nr:AIM24 family protein [Erysipelotrichia bacterium]
MNIKQLENEGRKIINRLENFAVLEHTKDLSVAPSNAETAYFMSKMGVKKRQVIIELDNNHSAVVQAGAMQWMIGNIQSTTGLKGVGDLFGKMLKSAVTKETAVKPEYVGNGTLVLEPTYKYIVLMDISEWNTGGMIIEDGMFLACDGKVEQKIVARSNLSSAVLGNEGLFNLCLKGSGIVALESNVPYDELIEVELNNDVLKIDGSFAVCWSAGLDFTVERSSQSLVGSMVNSEGLVNVYRGTGKVLLSPVNSRTDSLFATTHN